MKSILPQTLTVAVCQTFNDFLLHHLLVAFVDMDERYILCCKDCADEFASVALLRLSLTAHQGKEAHAFRRCEYHRILLAEV